MDWWTDDHTITDQVKAQHTGTLRVRVLGTRALAAANRVAVDGNDGKDGGTSGVGANQDDYVWEFKCVTPPVVADPPVKHDPPKTQDTGTSTQGGGVIVGGQGSTTTSDPQAPQAPKSPEPTTPKTTPSATPPTKTTTPTPPTTTPTTPTTPSTPKVTGSYSGNVSVTDDPGGHAPFIKPSATWQVSQLRDTTTGVITITINGVLPGISLSTTIPDTGALFTAATKGLVAGYKDVAVSFAGSITATGGVDGKLVVGANGALPKAKAISFGVKLAKQP